MDTDYPMKPPEAGFVIPSANNAALPLPQSNMYPTLGKINIRIRILFSCIHKVSSFIFSI